MVMYAKINGCTSSRSEITTQQNSKHLTLKTKVEYIWQKFEVLVSYVDFNKRFSGEALGAKNYVSTFCHFEAISKRIFVYFDLL